MRSSFAFAFFIVMASAAAAAPSTPPVSNKVLLAEVESSCYPDEPAQVTVTGILKEETFPGPPNYESVAEGDRAEQVFVLIFEPHICTSGSSYDDSTDEPNPDVDKSELVFLGNSVKLYDILRPYLDKKVQCKGQLFDAQNAEHHTSVLIQIDSKADCHPVADKSKS